MLFGETSRTALGVMAATSMPATYGASLRCQKAALDSQDGGEYPPMQDTASLNLSAVKAQVEEMIKKSNPGN